MKCNYDDWSTKVPVGLNKYHLAVLQLMSDGETRERTNMLREAVPPTDPNPRSENDFAGWNTIDYDLYKKRLLLCVAVNGGRKSFRISAAGRRKISS